MNTRLKVLRKNLKLTQKEFGESINLSAPNISNLEKGVINLTQRNISEICSKYNVNHEWLEFGNGDMFSPLTRDDEFNILVGKLAAENDSFKKNLIEEMLKLEDEDWIFIEKFIKRIAKK